MRRWLKFHRGPVIGYGCVVIAGYAAALSMGDLAWARGGGDIVLIVEGAFLLGLIWWDRSLWRHDMGDASPTER